MKIEDVQDDVWDDNSGNLQEKIDNSRNDEDSTKGIKLKWSDYVVLTAIKNLKIRISHQSNDCGKSYFPNCFKKVTYRTSFLRHKKRCRGLK